MFKFTFKLFSSLVVGATLISHAAAAKAFLSVNNSIPDQLPLIARVGKPYEWSLCPYTFATSDQHPITYASSNLPSWLTFDPTTLTFRGQPAVNDKGEQSIRVTASDSKTTAFSTFNLLVSTAPPPAVTKPLEAQLSPNPSLSSVFQLHNGSSLGTNKLALRVPPKWSFSIGFDGKSYTGPDDVFYSALLADGSRLPSWIKFGASDITFNGVSPSSPAVSTTSLALVASDVKGYRSNTFIFDLIVAAHELHIDTNTNSLPTINVTAEASFNVTLNSDADLSGVMLDGRSLASANLTALLLDVSGFPWLSYDSSARTLSGTPPGNIHGKMSLPVSLVSVGNQTLNAAIGLDVAPPFFKSGTIPSLRVGLGQEVLYDLSSDFSAHISQSDIQLSAIFDAHNGATSFLHFDSGSTTLSGKIPQDFSESTIQVSFVAYSSSTHSTSHATLEIHIPDAHPGSGPSQPEQSTSTSERRHKLIRTIGIISAVICTIIIIGIIIALMRWFGRVPDSAETGPASTRGYSIEDKRWYGLDEEDTKVTPSINIEIDEKTDVGPGPSLMLMTASSTSNPGRAVRKADFVAKLRAGAKAVTDTVRSVGGTPRRTRPAISKPMPMEPADIETGTVLSHAFDGGSCSTSERSGSSLDDRSLPHRRADFMPPQPSSLRRSVSVASTSTTSSGPGSIASEDAVVQTASRARSFHSMARTSTYSLVSVPTPVVPKRPRLVPFTSETRVPSPETQTPRVEPSKSRPAVVPKAMPLARMSSQRAIIERGSVDDWALGVTYVQALGEDPERLSVVSSATDRHGDINTLRSPRYSVGSYSLASSQQTTNDRQDDMPRVLARIGERFKIRMAVSAAGAVFVRLSNGGDLPTFVEGSFEPGMVEMWGIPGERDVGEYNLVAVDCETSEKVGRAVLEVVGKK